MSIGGDSKFIGGANTPFGGSDIYGFGARNISNAGGVYDRVARGGAASELMPMYMNPYTNEVIDRTSADITRMGQQQLNQVGADATRMGAFGGSRHGVVEGLTNSEMQKNIADASAQLRHAGFNTAAGLAQNDVGQALGAAGAMGNLGFGAYDLGRTIAGDQMQAGGIQQGLMQMILDKAGQQFQQTANQPASMLDMLLSATGMSPMNSERTQTQTYTPGLFDYLSLGAGTASSLMQGKFA